MSRILNCKCGFYISFGHSLNHSWDDPFYKYNPQCPSCRNPIKGSGPEVTFEIFYEMMVKDCAIIVAHQFKQRTEVK